MQENSLVQDKLLDPITMVRIKGGSQLKERENYSNMCKKVVSTIKLSLYPCRVFWVKIKSQNLLTLLIYPRRNYNKEISFVCCYHGKHICKVVWKCQEVSVGNLNAQYQCKGLLYTYTKSHG